MCRPLTTAINLLLLGLALGACSGNEAPPPKVILIIGDGMDDQQITMARNYLVGSKGRLVMDSMPYRGALQVQTVDENDPGIAVYVGDSASGATALATGVVTSIGRVATAAGTDENLRTILEMAHDAGFGTGIVTTTRIADATPASFIAHIDDRYCQSPSSMVEEDKTHPQYSTNCADDYTANGGRGSVAEQIVQSGIDVILGSGREDFAEPLDHKRTDADAPTVEGLARDNGFTMIQSSDELDGAEQYDRIIGLFSEGIMPVRLRGENNAVAEFISRRDGRVEWPAPVTCEDNPAFENMPTLAEMTTAALLRLDREDGFALIIESASIDDQAHYWLACGHIGEVGQLDETLEVALDYADAHPETLVIVTADHGHAAQIVPQISEFEPQDYASPGRFIRIRTPEGGIMGINYATNDSPDWEEHSGVQVPIYAYGPGVESLPTFMPQRNVFDLMAGHLGLVDTGAP